MTPMMMAAMIMTGNNHHAIQGMLRFLSNSLLKKGRNNAARRIPNANEKMLNSKDSVKNCLMRLIRCDPTTFLKPTSFARLADFAVERLIKLIHAMIKIKQAMAPKSQTNRISPFSRPSSILDE